MTTTTISRKIAYKRCSTDEDKQNVGRQLFGLTFDEVVVEYASGKNEKNRPLFQKCVSGLNKGDELHFQDLSRAGRNSLELQITVKDLVARGVKVVFHTEGLTFVGEGGDPMAQAMSEMMLSMLAAVNQIFLVQTSQAVKQGLKRAVAEGKKLGAASPKYQEKLKAGEINHVGKSRHANTTAHLLSIKALFVKSIELTKQGVVQSNGKVIKAKSFSQVAIALNTLNLCVPPSGQKWNSGSVQRAVAVLGIKL